MFESLILHYFSINFFFVSRDFAQMKVYLEMADHA